MGNEREFLLYLDWNFGLDYVYAEDTKNVVFFFEAIKTSQFNIVPWREKYYVLKKRENVRKQKI